MTLSEQLSYKTRHQKFVDVRDLIPLVAGIQVLENELSLYKKALTLRCNYESQLHKSTDLFNPDYWVSLAKPDEEG